MMINLKDKVQQFRRWQIEGKSSKPLDKAFAPEVICRNCGEVYQGNYCPNCGQSAKVSRLKFLGALKAVLPLVYNFDTRFLRTILELLTRPGHMIRNYIVDGKRVCYNNPISLLFVLAAVYLVINHLLFGVQEPTDATFNVTNKEGEVIDLFKDQSPIMQKFVDLVIYMYRDMAWSSLASTLLYVVPNKVAFRKTELGRRMSLTEHFYLMAFISCFTMILSIIGLIFKFLAGAEADSHHLMFSFVVIWWVMKQYFQITKRRSFRLVLWSLCMVFFIAIIVCLIFFLGVALAHGVSGTLYYNEEF